MTDKKEETYQDDLRMERAVWPEKFGTTTQIEWQERLLLAIQGIDVSLETIVKRADNFEPLEETSE
jgi:hypothetical protein